jgi:hypothetical protein
MAGNSNLSKAKREKNDEFYTQFADIENELKHYKEQFKDKIVFCNCDNPMESNFVRFFALNFENYGLKKLISTHFESTKKSYKFEITKGVSDIKELDLIEKIDLEQNGDFRSPECVEILKGVDIVVTNPPFSLFREYIEQLMTYEKKFLIIGNKNAITYKETFKYIKDNKLWLGISSPKKFEIPGKVGEPANITENLVGLCRWFTNLPNNKRSSFIDTGCKYYGNESKYPKYDNYDAINVDKISEIPMDYFGVMGVPITFLDSYCPKQFGITEIEKEGNKSLIKNAEGKIKGGGQK